MFHRTHDALLRKAEEEISIYWAGGCSAAIYLLTALFYRKGFMVPSHTEREVFAWFCIMPLLFFFWKGYQALSGDPEGKGLRTVAGFAALFGLLAFAIHPFNSEDIFAYMNTGWLQAHYGQNPYVTVPIDIAGWRQDPIFALGVTWFGTPASYGFLFSLLARWICRVGNGNVVWTAYLFKLVNLAAYGVTAWLVWAGASRQRLARPLIALYLFAWNPLILMQHVANGHNDLLAGCLIALSAYLAIAGSGAGSSGGADFWIIPVLTVATLIKDVPAVMIPFALLLVLKRKGWKTALLSCLAAALITVAVSMPYLRDWRRFQFRAIIANITGPWGSLRAVLLELFKDAAKLAPALAPWRGAVNTAIGATFGIGFVIFFAVLCVRTGRNLWSLPAENNAHEFVRQSLLAFTILLCLTSSRFEAWYLGMLLPLALFLEETDWLRRLVVALTIGEFFALTFLQSAFVINYIAMIVVPAWIVWEQERKRRGEAGAGGEVLPQTG